MLNLKTSLRTAAAFIAGLVLAGCALSPQAVNVNPQITPGSYAATGKRISVTVSDQRASKVLGTRGGIYAQTSNVTLSSQAPQRLKGSMAGALTQMGFQITTSENADVQMNVILDKLTYQPSVRSLIQVVDLSDAIRIVVSSPNGSSYTGSFKTEKHHEFSHVPSEETNSKIINELLAETLSHALQDPKLISAMSRY
ncbi:YajG family lipoprotein [Pokkaliibacter sp. CJK22405]|uniref:YajG family lipoprotein n=1 Tax=Pokkaliibacter sp. CJK22405 TaxID=3384615 RepID=UPI003984B7CB